MDGTGGFQIAFHPNHLPGAPLGTTMNTKRFALPLALLVLAGTVYATSGQDPAQRQGRRERATRSERFERVRQGREFLRGLEVTDAQRALALEQARAMAPRARELRREALRIRQEAREGVSTGDREAVRAETRERIRALRERARAELAPHGRALVDSLTPEQRAKIEARLAERGRTFDAQRASERAGRWLARPRVHDRVEARSRR